MTIAVVGQGESARKAKRRWARVHPCASGRSTSRDGSPRAQHVRPLSVRAFPGQPGHVATQIGPCDAPVRTHAPLRTGCPHGVAHPCCPSPPRRQEGFLPRQEDDRARQGARQVLREDGHQRGWARNVLWAQENWQGQDAGRRECALPNKAYAVVWSPCSRFTTSRTCRWASARRTRFKCKRQRWGDGDRTTVER